MEINLKLSQPKERINILPLKEFYSLSTEEHNKYLLQLFSIPVEERTSVVNHILKYHSLKPRVVEEFFIDF